MKRLALIFLAILALVLTATLAACTVDPALPQETGTTSAATEESTETPTEVPTEAVTDGDTTPAETLLFENSGVSQADPVTGSATLSKPYAEKITVSNGAAELSAAGVTMQFQSQFYGHDSAIDRDHAKYGKAFLLAIMDESLYKGDFFLGEYTGDHYQDMVLYADGVLTVYPAVVNTKNTFEYNGKPTIPSMETSNPIIPSENPSPTLCICRMRPCGEPVISTATDTKISCSSAPTTP
ncbi:MAG: hypothetical protein IJA91_01940 [Clostridia bacterium]|nr:hypothetical protein [Clostridia bacterium]